jgi:hypothetical protein
MEISRERLEASFNEMADDQLLARYAGGTLTELAQTVILEVLGKRGIAPPPLAPTIAPVAGEILSSTDLVLAAKFITATEAFLVRGLLESEGMPAIVADANMVQNNELLAIAVGGVRVLVPEEGLARAQEIIAAFRRGEYALDGGPAHDK